jgi:hypothetical protein
MENYDAKLKSQANGKTLLIIRRMCAYFWRPINFAAFCTNNNFAMNKFCSFAQKNLW